MQGDKKNSNAIKTQQHPSPPPPQFGHGWGTGYIRGWRGYLMVQVVLESLDPYLPVCARISRGEEIKIIKLCRVGFSGGQCLRFENFFILFPLH